MTRPRQLQDSRQSSVAQRRSVDPRITENETTIISEAYGDVILDVQAGVNTEVVSFKINSMELCKTSAYFERLLLDTRFAEGAAVAQAHNDLKEKYSNFAYVPLAELPHVSIVDVGQISIVKSIHPLMRDLLLILHGEELSTPKLPLTNIANMAIAADRFDCAPAIANYVRARGLLSTTRKSTHDTNEASRRQRLLIGIIFDQRQLFWSLTRQLVMSSSPRWRTSSSDSTLPVALWWTLPRGFEEEIHYRRQCILESISSLQTHLLSLYASKSRQCKLGYDSSPQCDSFQCGEYSAFLVRNGLLRFQSGYCREEEVEPYCGSIEDLIASLRQCPTYQVDANHSHCGPKKRLLQGLNVIQDFLGSMSIGPGICLECWNISPDSEAWADAKPPLELRVSGASGIPNHHVHGSRDLEKVRDFFLSDKTWIFGQETAQETA